MHGDVSVCFWYIHASEQVERPFGFHNDIPLKWTTCETKKYISRRLGSEKSKAKALIVMVSAKGWFINDHHLCLF